MTRLSLKPVDLNVSVEAQLNLNAQNHADLLPYTLKASDSGHELHVEREWWEQDLLEETRKKITEVTAKHSLQLIVDDTLPAGGRKERNVKQPWVDLYKNVFEQYEYEQWGTSLRSALPPIRTIQIPKWIQKELARLAKIKVLTGRSLKRHDLEDIEEDPWMAKLDEEIRAVGEAVFVKMPTTSSKNEQKMRPVTSAADCLEYITNTNCFAAELEWSEAASLIVLPWLDRLDRTHEYRVFVHRRRVTAISQQQWYKHHGHSQEAVRLDAEALLACFEREVKTQMPYASGVLDMWVERDPEAEGGAVKGGHLIEINPWGAGFSSGSSLFHWRRDYDVLYGNAAPAPAGEGGKDGAAEVEVRYTGAAWSGGSNLELIELMDDLHVKDQAVDRG